MDRRRPIRLALATAATAALGASAGTTAWAADDICRTVKQRDELGGLKLGQIIYGDLAAKVRIRIKAIDLEKKEICGRTSKGSKCFSHDKVYTGSGLAACGRGAPPEAILLLGDDSDDVAGDTGGDDTGGDDTTEDDTPERR